MEQPPLEVIVIDDRLIVRRGTELLLREAGLRVVATTDRLDEARSLLLSRRYDVALLEPYPYRGGGLALAEEIRRVRPDKPLVLYTDGTVSWPGMGGMLSAAIAVGALGFVLKSSLPSTLVEALRIAADGRAFLDPALDELLAAAPSARLTPREREILELLAEGYSGADIASRLFLSAETVRTHVRNATHKLGARSRVQAVALVVRDGA